MITKSVSTAAVVIAGIVVVIVQLAHPDNVEVGGRDWVTKLWFGVRESLNPDGSRTDWRELSRWDLAGRLSGALYGALWAYSGWDKVSLVCPRPRHRDTPTQCQIDEQLIVEYIPRQSMYLPSFLHPQVSFP